MLDLVTAIHGRWNMTVLLGTRLAQQWTAMLLVAIGIAAGLPKPAAGAGLMLRIGVQKYGQGLVSNHQLYLASRSSGSRGGSAPRGAA
jgi:hypothetical protein